jgi:site-specific DNA-methyltransferase (cytosine-N4-specific)
MVQPEGMPVDFDYRGYRGISLHPYPATMPYPLARDLLVAHSEVGDCVLDPFMGSGTTLRAAAAHGRNSIGIDLNPLACLIARVGIVPYQERIEIAEYDHARALTLDSINRSERYPDAEWLARINTWFLPRTQQGLAVLASAIDRCAFTDHMRDFVLLAFSRTVRRCSLTRPGELKLWKKAGEGLWEDPVEVFNHEATAILRDMASMNADLRGGAQITAKVIHGDAEYAVHGLADLDLVLTSPPYGDSWTTVAYGNFSMLSRIWLGAIEPSFVADNPATEDARSVGGMFRDRGEARVTDARECSVELANNYRAVYAANQKRAADLYRFFEDMYYIFGRVSRTLRRGGRLILVLGPRTVSGVPIDVGLILGQFLESFGLEHAGRQTRRITGKRLPSRTVHGEAGLGDTINDETIDVFQAGAP